MGSMINPAQYNAALRKMTDQQLQVLIRRPDKIPTQFVVQELNRRAKMRQASKAQEQSMIQQQRQPMQMPVEQSMANAQAQPAAGQQPPMPTRMMRSGGVTKLAVGSTSDYVMEINEAFGRKDRTALKNIWNDPQSPDAAKKLAIKMLEQLGERKDILHYLKNYQGTGSPKAKRVMRESALEEGEFDQGIVESDFGAVESEESDVSAIESADSDAEIKVPERMDSDYLNFLKNQNDFQTLNNQNVRNQKDISTSANVPPEADISDSGFSVTPSYKGLEWLSKIGTGGRHFLGIDRDGQAIKSPIGLDTGAKWLGEKIGDVAGGIWSTVKTPFEQSSEKISADALAAINKSKTDAMNAEAERFAKGLASGKVDLSLGNLSETSKGTPVAEGFGSNSKAYKALRKYKDGNQDNQVESPINKPISNGAITQNAGEITGTNIINANDLTAEGNLQPSDGTTSDGISQFKIPEEIKNMYTQDWTAEKAMEGYKKSNYLVKAGEAFDSMSAENQKIIDLHNKNGEALVKQREEMLGMIDKMGRTPENAVFQSLIDMGLSLMASPDANFAQALGKSGQVGMNTFRKLSQEEKDRVWKKYEMSWKLGEAERNHSMQGLQLAKQHKLDLITGSMNLHNASEADKQNYFNRANTVYQTKMTQAGLAIKALEAQSSADYRGTMGKVAVQDSNTKSKKLAIEALNAVPTNVKEAKWFMNLSKDEKAAAAQAMQALNPSTKSDSTTMNKLLGEVFEHYSPGQEPYDNLVKELTSRLNREPTSSEVVQAIIAKSGSQFYPPSILEEAAKGK